MISPVVYSFHMSETKSFVDKFAKENNFEVTHYWDYQFPLKKTMDFHKEKIKRIDVGVWRFEQKHI